MKNLNKTLQNARISANISVEKMAEILEVSAEKINEYEKDANKLTITQMDTWALHCNISLTMSFFSDGKKFPNHDFCVKKCKEKYCPSITGRRDRKGLLLVKELTKECPYYLEHIIEEKE